MYFKTKELGMFMKRVAILAILQLFLSCSQKQEPRISKLIDNAPKIEGKAANPEAPYLTAGNKIYMLSHQDEKFPNLGSHNNGEISGIWDNPIKLMDGFNVRLSWEGDSYELSHAKSFTNYPFANMLDFLIETKSIKVERWQFVPDDTEGITIQFEIFNEGDTQQHFDFIFTGYSNLRPTWLGERTAIVDGQDEATYEKEINGWLVKDKNNPWFVCFSSSEKPEQKSTVQVKEKPLTVSNTLHYPINVKPGKSKVLTFTIAGSYTSEGEAIKTLNKLKTELPSLVYIKKERYRKLAKQSKLTIPDKAMEETFEWLKYRCDWVMDTPMSMGMSDSKKMNTVLGAAEKSENPFKVITIDIDSDKSAESHTAANKTPKKNSNNGAISNPPTGVLETTENKYKRPNEALNYLEQIIGSFSNKLPENRHEVSSGFDLMAKTCNVYEFASSTVHQFFGIKSNTAKKEITITPKMPDKWNKVSLENVKIGDNVISIYYGKGSNSLTVRAIQTNWDWTIKLILPTNFKNTGLVVTQGNDLTADSDQFIISSKNGEIDATIYFE